MSYLSKLDKPGPKKLLACDGGGIRGIISIEILAKIEATLRVKFADSSLVLSDYFDYVAGTSTGAIIATLVSLGLSVNDIRDFYLKSGPEMFHPSRLLERIRSKFDNDNLSSLLKTYIGADTLFGADSFEPNSKLKTLLMIVLRNATTDSPWPISNNPSAKYNVRDSSEKKTNLHLPLWQLVRGSTAAPIYFPPEIIDVAGKEFIFVDGGVTTYNNPAFQLFLMATTEPYKLCWAVGESNIQIVSVGTGATPNANKNLTAKEMNVIYNAVTVPTALMAAALHEQDFLCRIFGRCLAGDKLDREVGTAIGQGIPGMPKLFTYVRYNAELSAEGLNDLGLSGIDPTVVQPMDSIDHIPEMQQVGAAVGAQKVKVEHFADFTL